MFNKKYYKMIAEALYEADITPRATRVVAEELAERFRKDNPNFDSKKFIDTCLGGE